MEMDCPICLGSLSRSPDGIEDNVRRRLTKIRTATCCCTPCGHIFHKACLLRWLDRSNRPPCPVCNEKLSKMTLYPVYLNVDKDGTTGTGPASTTNEDGDSLGGGAGAQPSLANSNNGIESNSHSSEQHRSSVSINATCGSACAGFCAVSQNAPGPCGVATMMTLGSYALTSSGPVPVVTATTIGMIPAAHSNCNIQSAGLENQGSAFMAVPPSNPNSLSRPPVRATTNTFAAWRGPGAEATITSTISTDREYPFGGGTSITTTILGNGFQPSVIKRSLGGFDNAGPAPAHYNRDLGNARYHPYLQPPPAHAMSSSSFSRRREHDQVYNTFYSNAFGAGEGSGIGGGVPASRTHAHGHSSASAHEYGDGSPTQKEN